MLVDPPSSLKSGWDKAFAFRSQSAMSIKLTALRARPSNCGRTALARRAAFMLSTSIGLAPWTFSMSASIAALIGATVQETRQV